MLWFLLANLTAFAESWKDVFSKQSLQKNVDAIAVPWCFALLTFAFLAPLLLAIGIPELGKAFPLALLAGSSLNVLATLLYVRALQATDLSLAVPLVTFTPLFLLLAAPAIVGERPGLWDGIGTIAIVVGAYLLNVRKSDRNWLAPLQNLWRQPGSRWMLAVAFLWSLTSSFDKMGVRNSSPIFWAIASYGAISLWMAPFALRRLFRRQTAGALRSLVLMGFCNAIVQIFQMNAMNLAPVVRTIAIKRTSVLWSVLWGALLFGEPEWRKRAIAAIVMLSGMAAILLG